MPDLQGQSQSVKFIDKASEVGSTIELNSSEGITNLIDFEDILSKLMNPLTTKYSEVFQVLFWQEGKENTLNPHFAKTFALK